MLDFDKMITPITKKMVRDDLYPTTFPTAQDSIKRSQDFRAQMIKDLIGALDSDTKKEI